MTTLATPDAPLPRGPGLGVAPGASLLPGIATERDEAAARRALRAQITRLEAQLAPHALEALTARPRTFAEGLRMRGAADRTGAHGAVAAPRVLSLGELEAQRDRLAERLREERDAKALLADRQEDARALREEVLADPAAHPYVRITNADVGEPGCLDYHVRPRFGLLGMLMRWWRVHISSGCP